MIETDNWPFIKAKNFTRVIGKIRYVRVIVIHTAEAPRMSNTAELVAGYFQSTNNLASSHVIIDSNSIIQCVKDNDVAFAAPGANHDGIQIELAGYAKQVSSEWLDDYGKLLLNNLAEVCGQYCMKYSIPAEHLTDSQLKHGDKGVVGHYQVSNVYKRSTHTDPGVNFPWEYLINLTRSKVRARKEKLGI